MPQVFAIEGLDRLGKTTLIDGILNKEGFYQVIHFGKPKKLQAYEEARLERPSSLSKEQLQLYFYQVAAFRNSMLMAKSGSRIIFDRWHLGECVYSPLYRGYSGDYVFSLEASTGINERNDIRLILLTEDFDRSNHFKSDGGSFDDTRRREEQELFIKAFNSSSIRDKKIICVTGLNGNFRSKEEILREALL